VRVGFDMTPAVLAIAGVGRYTTELAGALARTPGVELERLGFPGLGDGDPVRRRATRVARSLAYYPVTLSRQAARRRVELVHCPGPVAALRTGLPLVLTIHDMLPWRYPEMFGRVAVARQRLLVGRVARSADRILVGAEYTRRDVVEYLDVSPRRVEVVPHGVDARFTPRQTDPLRLAHRFGIPPGPFVLWVGTLEPRKNLASLLRAFALVRRRAPETSLVLVGEWGLADAEVERDLDQLGRSVIRPGFVTDEELSILYSATTCFVFPSLYEGFGLPPLEAMACGTPVMASKAASLPEVVGDAGLLVDPLESEQMAAALERRILDEGLRADLRRRGLERTAGFTWEAAARTLVDVYRRVGMGG
jgi:glycosyltransferase involved in cell wall biosynthesis